MALTRDFKNTIRDRAQKDSDFRKSLLIEAVNSLLADELDVAKSFCYLNRTWGVTKKTQWTYSSQHFFAFLRKWLELAKPLNYGLRPFLGLSREHIFPRSPQLRLPIAPKIDDLHNILGVLEAVKLWDRPEHPF